MTKNTLDTRIAELLVAPEDQPSTVFADILAETATAIHEADETARVNRERAFDPMILDPVARGKSDDATFVAARLRAGQAALQPRHAAAVAREQAEAWNQSCDDVEMQVAQVADELLEKYPRAAAELIDLFGRIAQVDKAVDHINGTAPTGCGRRLRGVELVARAIDRFGSYDVKVTEKTVLHALVVGETGAKQLWPIVQPNEIALAIMSWFPQNGSMRPGEQEYYEPYFDDERGCWSERRKVDAPPLRVVPPPLTLQQQQAAEEQRKAEEALRWIENTKAQEEGRVRLNAEAAARTEAFEKEQRKLRAGEMPR